MTNLERWRCYMSDCTSPDSYIDMGFYSMIASSLQRRVWVGSEQRPLFPNMFIILVGKPGIGKGRVLSPLNKILRYHKAATANSNISARDISDVLLAAEGKIGADEDEALLFPMAPQQTTFESLVRELGTLLRIFKISVRQLDGTVKVMHYTHKSMSFVLEELSSIIPKGKNAENVINFFLTAFDCEDYDYSTKHQGKDKLRKICLNLIAGTTPDFMQDAFDSKLIGQGFAARTLFVYEYANRSNRFADTTSYTPEQMEAKKGILAHIHGLSKLYGQVTYTPEAFEMLRHYFEEVLPVKRVNYSPKLEGYYARKNIHAQKMAIAVHFADSYSMVIGPRPVQQAFNILEGVERKMHLALNFGKNPLASISSAILTYIKTSGPQSFQQLWTEFNADLREQELKECINFLCGTNRVKIVRSPNGETIYHPL